MSEIDTDYDDSWYSGSFKKPEGFLKEQSSGCETIGCMSFAASAFIAFSIYIPAAVKKKRTYSIGPVPTLGPSTLEPVQIVDELAAPAELRETAGYACNATDRANIVHLFTEIADASAWDLVWKGLSLRALGNSIKHVHPLALLACAPNIKMNAILTSGNPLKTRPFMDSIKLNLAQEAIQGNLAPHIETFAEEVGRSEERIRQLIQARDWANFVYYLFDVGLLRDQ